MEFRVLFHVGLFDVEVRVGQLGEEERLLLFVVRLEPVDFQDLAILHLLLLTLQLSYLNLQRVDRVGGLGEANFQLSLFRLKLGIVGSAVCHFVEQVLKGDLK